ncbi:hypothetical protein JQ628_29885 [Bradyrhizobium lablabi]|uniref:hypothetical protein n=1 Tax=Bradyrhizobium lablabi TaxID=722472 RepID=UPI001BAA2590|nr:hypothetical protein [Bradyrhizobium lablabi]MBR1125768.1 hypothetical protein [Bradyrhizobium lablabi]
MISENQKRFARWCRQAVTAAVSVQDIVPLHCAEGAGVEFSMTVRCHEWFSPLWQRIEYLLSVAEKIRHVADSSSGMTQIEAVLQHAHLNVRCHAFNRRRACGRFARKHLSKIRQ